MSGGRVYREREAEGQLGLFGQMVQQAKQKKPPAPRPPSPKPSAPRPPAGYHPAPRSRKSGWTDGHGHYWYATGQHNHASGGEEHPEAEEMENDRAIDLHDDQIHEELNNGRSSQLRRRKLNREKRLRASAEERRQAAEKPKIGRVEHHPKPEQPRPRDELVEVAEEPQPEPPEAPGEPPPQVEPPEPEKEGESGWEEWRKKHPDHSTAERYHRAEAQRTGSATHEQAAHAHQTARRIGGYHKARAWDMSRLAFDEKPKPLVEEPPEPEAPKAEDADVTHAKAAMRSHMERAEEYKAHDGAEDVVRAHSEAAVLWSRVAVGDADMGEARDATAAAGKAELAYAEPPAGPVEPPPQEPPAPLPPPKGTDAEVDAVRREYPAGTRIRTSGMTGTVLFVNRGSRSFGPSYARVWFTPDVGQGVQGDLSADADAVEKIEPEDRREAVAAWAVASYPHEGDAAFLVHGEGVVPPASIAGHFWQGLKSHFIARPFVRVIQRELAEAKGEVATSVESQEQAGAIWAEHAESFLHDMHAAHDGGGTPFGEKDGAVRGWLKGKGLLPKPPKPEPPKPVAPPPSGVDTPKGAVQAAYVKDGKLHVPIPPHPQGVKHGAKALGRWLVGAEGRAELVAAADALDVAPNLRDIKVRSGNFQIGVRPLTEAELRQRREAAKAKTKGPTTGGTARRGIDKTREAALAARGQDGKTVAAQVEKDERDWGEKIGGAAKDRWDAVHSRNLGAMEEEEGAEFAHKHVTKARVLGSHDPEHDKALGSTPGASLIKRELFKKVAPRPENSPGHRSNYVAGCDWLAKMMDVLHHEDDVASFLEDWKTVAVEGTERDVDAKTFADLRETLGIVLWNRQHVMDHHAAPGRWGKFRAQGQWWALPATEAPGGSFKVRFHEGEFTPREQAEWLVAEHGRRNELDALKKSRGSWALHRRTQDTERLQRYARALGGSFNTQLTNSTSGNKDSALWVRVKQARAGSTAWEDLGVGVDKEKKKRDKKGNAPRSSHKWKGSVEGAERKGGPAVPAVITEEKLAADFGIKRGEYGRSIGSTGELHLRKCYEAFTDLTDLLGLDAPQMGNGGELAMAFGARGRGGARAHYETVRKVINITKMAAGSLAHEWGHYLDDLMGGAGLTEVKGRTQAQFASHGPEQYAEALDPKLKEAMMAVRAAILSKDPEASRLRDKALEKARGLHREAREAFDQLRALSYGEKQGEKGRALGLKREELRVQANAASRVAAQLKEKAEKPSKYAADAKKLGGYWERPHEMFARAFESFIEDSLVERGRVSDYLVQGTKPLRDLWKKTKEKEGPSWDRTEVEKKHEALEPYPQGDERTRINTAMRELVEALKGSDHLRKGLTSYVYGSIFGQMVADRLLGVT